MESEAPVTTRIFFKDKKNEIKGPFTEGQVQKWYKEGWFKDSSFSFYFVRDDSSPDDSSSASSFTLDELCSRNRDAPFSLPSNSTQSALHRLEEALRALRVEDEGVVSSLPSASPETVPEPVAASSEGAEKRTKKMKKKNQRKNKKRDSEVSSGGAAAPAAPAAAAAPEQLPPWERQELLHEWAEGAAEFFMEMCEFFKGGKNMRLVHEPGFFPLIETRVQILHENGTILLQELFRRIRQKPFLFCSFCDRFMYTVGQTFQHICSLQHVSKINRLSMDLRRANNLLMNMMDIARAQRIFKEESEELKSHRERFASMSLDDPELRPTKRYIVESNMDFHANSIPGKTPFTKGYLAQAIATKLHAKPELAQEMLTGLIEHVGEAKTVCHKCKLIFANLSDYCNHLMTFDHIRQTDLFDNITMVVNVLFGRRAETIDERQS